VAEKREGICHICGKFGTLSFEHVPPKAAFNDSAIIRYGFDEIIAQDDALEFAGGEKRQQGAGGYTLCEPCNNKSGAWYGSRFVEWARQADVTLRRSYLKPMLFIRYQIYPLAILKQVVAMFMSLIGPRFSEKNPILRSFVVDRRVNQFPPDVHIYAFYAVGPTIRTTAGFVGEFGRAPRYLAEMSFPPFGFLLTLTKEAPHPDMIDITGFASYRYDELALLNLRLPVLETLTPLPGDYRSREELARDIKKANDLANGRP
jgi:hypothetical protein